VLLFQVNSLVSVGLKLLIAVVAWVRNVVVYKLVALECPIEVELWLMRAEVADSGDARQVSLSHVAK